MRHGLQSSFPRCEIFLGKGLCFRRNRRKLAFCLSQAIGEKQLWLVKAERLSLYSQEGEESTYPNMRLQLNPMTH